MYMYMYQLVVWVLATTVDWEIFALKIFRRLNFRRV